MILRVAALVPLLWLLGFAVFATGLATPADDARTDAIVVVTGGPGRIQRGVAMLAAGKARRMLISGVDRRVRAGELAVQNHIPRRLVTCCIDLGRESVDTRSNADETAAWVARNHYRSLRLVTTDWHMARARFELSRMVGRDIRIVPDAVRSEPALLVLLTEYNKYLLRRITAPMGI